MPRITVRWLIDHLKDSQELRVVAGESNLDQYIEEHRVQKTGLALTGFVENIHPGRIQVMGNNEIKFLDTLPVEKQRATMELLATVYVPAIIVSRDMTPSQTAIDVCEERGIPLIISKQTSSPLIWALNRFLEEELAPMTSVHGVLVDVSGVGVLLTGKSGVGKSECALDLLQRGHRLVADDVVVVHKIPPSLVWGSSDENIRYHMEVRGLGIINIKDLFGITSVRSRKRIELVLELVEWDKNVEYDRLGLEHKTYTILDVKLPYTKIPVSYGRNLASIVEVAARNFLLRLEGHNSAQGFNEQQMKAIAMRAAHDISRFDKSTEIE